MHSGHTTNGRLAVGDLTFRRVVWPVQGPSRWQMLGAWTLDWPHTTMLPAMHSGLVLFNCEEMLHAAVVNSVTPNDHEWCNGHFTKSAVREYDACYLCSSWAFCIISTCVVYSRLKRCKNYQNRLRLTRVTVKICSEALFNLAHPVCVCMYRHDAVKTWSTWQT